MAQQFKTKLFSLTPEHIEKMQIVAKDRPITESQLLRDWIDEKYKEYQKNNKQ